MAEQDLNILIVDDTVMYRRVLTDVVGHIEGATVCGTAPNGKVALAKMKQTPVDVVFLDVEMPVMDGLETLEKIREEYPEVGVIMVSGANRSSADITLTALQKGALDFVPKPEGGNIEQSRAELVEQLRNLILMFSTRRRLRPAQRGGEVPAAGKPTPAAVAKPKEVKAPPAAPAHRAGPLPTQINVVAIGVSTGGPKALAEVVPLLPANLGVPVLIVQHMPPVFTKSLADSLDKKSPLPVCEAVEGESIEANKVYIAPGGRHMVVRKELDSASKEALFCIGLNDNPPENSCRPAVDVLFRSVSAHYGNNVLSVIMTGMGNDGREGVRAMKRRGCICLTQSEDTCVIYGMPMAVDDAGLSDASIPLHQLAERIGSITRSPACLQ